MPDFIRVTWIDVDRDKERDVTQEQKQTYELAVNLKENEPTQRSFILDGWKFSIVEIGMGQSSSIFFLDSVTFNHLKWKW